MELSGTLSEKKKKKKKNVQEKIAVYLCEP